MKKICFILRSHPAVALGGAELQSLCIAEELTRRGWEVHYISEYKGKFPPNTHNNRIILHWLKARAAGSGCLNFFALSKLLRQLKPDVIYQRVADDYTGIVGFLSKSYKIPLIWAASSDRDCQKDKFRLLTAQYKNPLRKLIQHAKFWVCDKLISYGIKGANIALVQSEDQQKLLARDFGRTSTVVKNGLPSFEYHMKKSKTITVLWVGNIKRLKRVDLFIDLARECQSLPIKFVIIGKDSKDEYLRNLLLDQLNCNIEYLGPLDVKKTECYIACASILVNTSEYEGFPNTFIQAWVGRTPVVSLNVDPDGIIKKCHLGFHSGTFNQMIEDVKLLISDTRLRQNMGENAYHYAVQEHNIQKTVDSMERIIKSVVLV